jgi:hypothetical protein
MADLMTLIDELRNAEREYGRNPRNQDALFTATRAYSQIEEMVAGMEGRASFEGAKRQVDAKPDHPLVMALHAGISRRSWNEVEQAANRIRDEGLGEAAVVEQLRTQNTARLRNLRAQENERWLT